MGAGHLASTGAKINQPCRGLINKAESWIISRDISRKWLRCL
jgi:hypothetical protein